MTRKRFRVFVDGYPLPSFPINWTDAHRTIKEYSESNSFKAAFIVVNGNPEARFDYVKPGVVRMVK